jgi:hypothetical protein
MTEMRLHEFKPRRETRAVRNLHIEARTWRPDADCEPKLPLGPWARRFQIPIRLLAPGEIDSAEGRLLAVKNG